MFNKIRSDRYGTAARGGASIIDLIVSLGILALLFAGIYLVYFSIVDAVTNIEVRTAATSVLNDRVEVIRNLPYDKVGTVGGIPAGVIPQTQTVTVGTRQFALTTTIRNVDDPFDGTAGGTPGDTAPADYKLVAFEIGCSNCQRFVPLSFTTTVAPKNLESASSTGSLFVNVFDAAGVAVAGATVHIQNSSTSPAIDLTDVTTNGGVLQLVGVPTSTQSYHIQVSKNGYSSDQTYPQGGTGNPNPVKPNATVASQSVTNVSFAIDQVSSLAVYASDATCHPYAGRSFSLAGAKLIGTSPDVLKFATTSVTAADGSKTFSSLEWDSYALALGGTTYDVLGTIPFSPIIVNPGTVQSFRFVLQPAAPSSLLVTVKDAATAEGIANANVSLSKTGFAAAQVTGHSALVFDDWSGGGYAAKSAGMDTDSSPGSLGLLLSPSSTYPSPDAEWLISNTIDLGGATSMLYSLAWSGTAPPSAGSDSVRFQLAANNDNATWDFVGPDGTGATYYAGASSVPAAALNGKRYIRYKIFLATADPSVTPQVGRVMLEFNSVCVPPYQALFSNLTTGNYTLQVSAPGHATDTQTVSVSSDWQTIEVSL